MTDPGQMLLALDFDGTLAPIVEDPESAYIHPTSLAALRRLGPVLGAIVIITGRPVDQVRRLGRFEEGPGLEHLVVFGQYGAERWDAATGQVRRPTRPQGVSDLAECLPAWLEEHGASRIRVEDKGLAIALHTRGVAPGLLDELRPQIEALAEEVGLHVEPGRQVMELRASGSDKGQALRHAIEPTQPHVVMYAGDDLGDLPAFEEGLALRADGVDVTLVCSASAEQDALVPLADVVLDGPDAVATWLSELADSLVPV
ncbi:trehalose-phosphatase [Aeromicrobium duanguangcaii]|uniref:Trehalose 6-phosphate phosphatase n=1 Tax=Aeromicrobium duanguangcaii TaxID=2968086 RepID=A0ABY5KGG0_9ACTN|nr:trehalose-phosphatase [Aeromicrobium duanguangcaii]MCD9155209.1 trehalose-phosphatase [Aeromicrobium duanguangcaii]MCL3838560.1 trehalose-phosphatase [Aeromicrobium duanguangcaii]UUI68140.1 trehalose-phosphatase [Aeromicrobium duanguangcaii]